MARADDTLLKMNDEILNDINSIGYSKKEPSEIAILMNTPMSKSPQEFKVTSADKRGIISEAVLETMNQSDVDTLATLIITNGLLPAKLFDDITTEVLESRADQLSLGFVTQGDVEQALK